ncbi:hypothetical protein CMS1072 [Clavibacter sepedonicus]|uniref:Type VII secretion system protein EssD-like domain-containing protein n=3 Tax=Microbacteriaceae TaxID=85023 RepID=B0RGD0_CLASE|nr:hypothetical protein CMS1072 [Clavibacter sepedonicus]
MCRADGLIDPGSIPGVGMSPDLIRSAASTLATASTGVSQHGASAVASWQTMSTVYQAPESEALLAVMAPVGQETTALADGFTKVAKALKDFADTVEPIVVTLKDLQTQAVAFVALAEQGYDLPAVGDQPTTQLTDYGSVQTSPGGMYSSPAHHVEWTDYPPYNQRNDELIKAVAVQATALDEAQADCVNAIAAADPTRASCAVPVQGTDFTAAAVAGTALPFGQMASGRQTCVGSFLGGAGDAVTSMAEGLGSLISYNPETSAWGDWGHAGASALGVVEGLGALIAPTPIFQMLADDSSGVTPGWMRDFSRSTVDKQRQMVEGFVGSGEQWESDPARAAGSLFVNVGSLLIPVGGEVAAGAKVVSVGARVASVGGRVAEAADAASVAGRVAGAGARATVAAGTGLVRVGDLLTQAMAKADAVGHAATAPVMNALRDAVGRVPLVRVVVEHAVTPEGFRVPAGLRVEVEGRVRSQIADAAGHGVLERGTVEAPAGSGHAPGVGRAAGADAVRGVEQHGADARGGAEERATSESTPEEVRHHAGDAHASHSDQIGRHDRGGVTGDPSRGSDGIHSREATSVAHPLPSEPLDYFEDDYWRSLSPQEIHDLPVVRDGSHLRPDRSLEPSTWYQAGEHEYLYRTNEHGHIDRVIIQDLQLKTHEGRLPHQRNPVGKLQGDHAGHLAADAAGGSPKLDNIVAMSQKNNLVEYARLERKLLGRKAAHPDERIFLDIRLDPDPLTGRSPRFEVEYKINGRIYRSNFKQ